jgi:sugar lactone lactonase YvrE
MHAATLRDGTSRAAFPLLVFCALIACGDAKTLVAPAETEPALSKGGATKLAVPTARLLASGLEGGFGSTVGPDGALYVAETAAGRIARVDPETGALSTFANGLPVNQGTGLQDVAFVGHTAYALVSFVTPEAFGGTGVDGIYRVDGPNSFTIIADIGAFNRANPPETDFFVSTGVLVAMEPFRNGFLVTDGHLNRVLYVTRDGEISVFRAFANVVPTGLKVRGTTVYMTQAGPVPHLPENGKVVAFGPTATPVTEIASGIRLAVDVELGRGRTLFALSQGFWAGAFEGAPAEPNTGALIRVNADGGLTTLVDGLDQPISLEIIQNIAYVVTLPGEIWMIDNIAAPPFGRSVSIGPRAKGNSRPD